ncbi:MAG: hypothetical protein ACRDC3_08605 [Paraclostridium dentum]|uniref:hypothetical protein n=1 Tax=Paraclostridium dentum TaxID=2662455 RepID=UPI003EE5EBEE
MTIVKHKLRWVKNPKLWITIFCIATISGFLFIGFLLISVLIGGITFGGGFKANDLFIALATILGGYFGLIGGVLGVIGAYLIFKLQLNYNEESKKKESFRSLYEMINNSVHKTQEVMEKVVNRYMELDVENISILTGDITLDLKFIYSKNFNQINYGISNDEARLLEKFKADVSLYFSNENYQYLIYHEEWYKNLEFLTGTYISEIAEWFNTLNFNRTKNVYSFLETRNTMINVANSMLETKLFKSGFNTLTYSIHGYIDYYDKKRSNIN